MGCVDPDHAVTEVHLNISAPFEPDALFLSITTSLLSAFIIFKALVDSSSMHCFVDPWLMLWICRIIVCMYEYCNESID